MSLLTLAGVFKVINTDLAHTSSGQTMRGGGPMSVFPQGVPKMRIEL
jgi:hypothetical protein